MGRALEGKVVVITGGSRGIGKAIAIACADESSHLFLMSRKRDELTRTVDELRSKYPNIRIGSYVADLTKPEEIKKFALKAVNEFKRVDILVNNAGVWWFEDFIGEDDDHVNAMIDVNFKGLVFSTKEFLKTFKSQRKGVIINISSQAGKHAFGRLSVYCATKYAVQGFSESLAQEVDNLGIKVFTVCPGGVNTKMFHEKIPGTSPDELIKPEDVAKKVVSLMLTTNTVPNGGSVDVN